MASLNISFDVPQTPTFQADEFRRQVIDYANKLIIKLSTPSKEDAHKGHRVYTKEELSPEMQDILRLAEPLNGTLPESDLDGDTAREEVLRED